MCGIAGFNWDDRALIKSMLNLIKHRGPDDYGFYTDKYVSLGNRRLSIIDLSKKGKQPISNEDGTKLIVFNGEIYNFKELRDELQKAGHKFKSDTDTEVIIHSYEEHGIKCVEKFNGMFAFAIWDLNKKELFIARDRLGIKPLFYYFNNKKFIFASEIKSIRRAEMKAVIDNESLYFYLTYGYTPSNKSIFENIYKLEAGCTLLFKDSKIKIERYWSIDFSKKIDKNEDYFIKRLRGNLDSSVKSQLIADVPVGAFLSGGIDSSAIVAYTKKYKDDLKTFSISFDYEQFDESKYAKLVSDKFQTEHYEYMFGYKDVVKLVPKLVEQYDEPFGDPSSIPTYLVSKIAGKHVKVSLSGDGGDESFLGYDRYKQYKAINYQNYVPKMITKDLINPLVHILSNSINNKWTQKIRRYAEFNVLRDYEQYSELRSNFSYDIRKSLYPKHYNFYYYFKKFFIYNNYLENISNVDINTYLVDVMLTKLDRSSMFVSLEGRVPFLDHNFMEFSSSIPMNLKLKNMEAKYILKKALIGVLPKSIIYRKKQGFSFPLEIYLKKELKSLVRDSLLEKSELHNYVNRNYINKLLSLHYSNKKNYANGLWGLFILKTWLDSYLNNN